MPASIEKFIKASCLSAKTYDIVCHHWYYMILYVWHTVTISYVGKNPDVILLVTVYTSIHDMLRVIFKMHGKELKFGGVMPLLGY
jgi:hypothetical protein